jgi:hypothetical protein
VYCGLCTTYMAKRVKSRSFEEPVEISDGSKCGK